VGLLNSPKITKIESNITEIMMVGRKGFLEHKWTLGFLPLTFDY